MQKFLLRRTLLLTAAILIVSACSSAANNETFPVGMFAPPVQRTAGIEMVFSADGTYVMSGPQFIPINGTYVLDQDKVVVTDIDGLCQDIPGTYSWAFDGQVLTFTAVEDNCSIRRLDWQAGPWVKQL
jgi:hypothetical protein